MTNGDISYGMRVEMRPVPETIKPSGRPGWSYLEIVRIWMCPGMDEVPMKSRLGPVPNELMPALMDDVRRAFDNAYQSYWITLSRNIDRTKKAVRSNVKQWHQDSP